MSRPNGIPVINPRKQEKVFIVTPTSLVQNWKKEFTKWLGSVRVNPICIGETTKQQVTKSKLLANSCRLLKTSKCLREQQQTFILFSLFPTSSSGKMIQFCSRFLVVWSFVTRWSSELFTNTYISGTSIEELHSENKQGTECFGN